MATEPQKSRIARWLPAILAGLWLVAAATGQRALLNYDFAAAAPGTPPANWPSASKIVRAPSLPSIVVVAHPQCPCSRATVEELARIMALLQNKVTATVVFVRPSGFSRDWETTDLWRNAARIPGVAVLDDLDGLEASRFGAFASGQTMLYDSAGDLRFSGGITPSRGHAGDSLGRSAILSVVNNENPVTSRTSVYGCSLHNPERAVRE